MRLQRARLWVASAAMVVAFVGGCAHSSGLTETDEDRVVAHLQALGLWADMYAAEHLRVEGEKRWKLPDSFDPVAKQYQDAGELQMSLANGQTATFTYVGAGLSMDDRRELVFVCALRPGGLNLAVTVGGRVRELSRSRMEEALARSAQR